MLKVSICELILLHLVDNGPTSLDDDVYPYEISTTGITDALGVDKEQISERMKVISALSDMKNEGLIEEDVGDVERFDRQRNVYLLTREGREYAENFRDRLVKREITVRGSNKEYEAELGEVVEETSITLVRTLSGLEGDVLYLEEDFTEDRFVDRRRELDSLQDKLAEVKETGTRTVFVSGERGVGKTFLVSRFGEIAEEKGFEFLRGRCQESVSEPYHPFRNAFSPYLDSVETDPFGEGTTVTGEGFEKETAIIDGEEEIETHKKALFREFTEIVTRVSEEKPLVVFIDDLHWIDHESLELFDFLTQNVENNILFVGAYRPEGGSEDADFIERTEGEDSQPLRIHLDKFGIEETRQVIERLTKRRNIPKDFVELIHEKTGGNPLFTREIVNQMIEEKVAQPEEGVFPSERYRISVPEEIEETIEKRLRSLDSRGLEIVERCSVIGDEINFELLNELVESDESDLRDYLDLLCDTQILSQETEKRYEFVNSVARDVVLGNLSQDEKKEIHRNAGDAVIEISGDYDEGFERIGYHYDKAGENEKAMRYYLRAGERAEGIYALEKALDNYKRGLKIARELDDSEVERSTVMDIGRIHYLIGNFDEADKYFEYFAEQAPSEIDNEALRRCRRYQAKMRVRLGDFEGSEKIIESCLSMADDDPVTREVCILIGIKGWAEMSRGNLGDADEILKDQLEMAQELDEEKLEAKAIHNLGTLRYMQGDFEQAIEYTRESIRIFEELPDELHGLSSSLVNLGAFYLETGQLKAAREVVERSIEIKRKISDEVGIITSLTNLGLIDQRKARFDEALEKYEKVLERCAEAGENETKAIVLGNMGDIYRHKGDFETGLRYLERSLELAEKIDNERQKVFANIYCVRIKILQDELDKALEIAENSLELAKKVGDEGARTGVMEILGNVHREIGNIDKAIEYHKDGLETITEKEDPEREAKLRIALAEDQLFENDLESAKKNCENAVSLAKDISQPHLIEKAKTVLGIHHRKKGNYAESRERLSSALETASEIGATVDEARILYELSLLNHEHQGGDKRNGKREHSQRARDISEENEIELYVRKYSKMSESS